VSIYRRVWSDGTVCWYARWRAHGVEHREAAGPTRAHATALLALRIRERQEARHGIRIGPPGPPRSVSSLLDAYISQARARGRRSVERMERLARNVTASELGARPADVLREADLDTYVEHRKEAVSPSTINRELALTRAALRLAERRGEIPRGCVPHVSLLREPPGRCRVLSPDEEDRALAACPAWLRALVVLAINTGCRQGELLSLRWSSVDTDAGWLHLEQTKSGARRDVPLNTTARAVLESRRGGKGSLVFPTRRGTQIARTNLARAWRAACARAEVPDCRWHDLRHTTGGRVATATGSLLAVQGLLGHRSITMAARYGHLADARVREAVEAVDRGQRGCGTGNEAEVGSGTGGGKPAD